MNVCPRKVLVQLELLIFILIENLTIRNLNSFNEPYTLTGENKSENCNNKNVRNVKNKLGVMVYKIKLDNLPQHSTISLQVNFVIGMKMSK